MTQRVHSHINEKNDIFNNKFELCYANVSLKSELDKLEVKRKILDLIDSNSDHTTTEVPEIQDHTDSCSEIHTTTYHYSWV